MEFLVQGFRVLFCLPRNRNLVFTYSTESIKAIFSKLYLPTNDKVLQIKTRTRFVPCKGLVGIIRINLVY